MSFIGTVFYLSEFDWGLDGALRFSRFYEKPLFSLKVSNVSGSLRSQLWQVSWNESQKKVKHCQKIGTLAFVRPTHCSSDASNTLQSSSGGNLKGDCSGSFTVILKNTTHLYTLICKAVPTQQHTNQLWVSAVE